MIIDYSFMRLYWEIKQCGTISSSTNINFTTDRSDITEQINTTYTGKFCATTVTCSIFQEPGGGEEKGDHHLFDISGIRGGEKGGGQAKL